MTIQIEKRPVPERLSTINSSKYRLLDTMHASDIPMYNGKFQTGLDKYSLSISSISSETERNKKIESVNKIRKDLEIQMGVSLDQDTPEGKKFLSDYIIEFSEIGTLDDNIPNEKFLNYIIKENITDPFFPVALSKKEYDGDTSFTKDYHISDIEQDINDAVSAKRLLNKAKALLDNMMDTDTKKMKNIAFNVLSMKEYFNVDISNEALYDLLDSHIENKFNTSYSISHKSILEQFIELANLPKAELDFKTVIEKAIRYNILKTNSKTGSYYNVANPTILLGNKEEVIQYYSQPVNQDEFGYGKDNDLPISLKKQIKTIELIR